MKTRLGLFRRRAGHHWTPIVAAAVTGVVALTGTAWAEPATVKPVGRHDLRVMTRNVYLGADLASALTARDTPALLTAVSKIFAGVRATDFAVRAEGLAAEIERESPDLIGLQEVTTWTTAGPGAGPSQDFLAILRSALARRGLHYTVASTSPGFDVGPIPLTAPCASPTVGACTLRLRDSDVVLANDRTPGLRWSTPKNGLYQARLSVPLPAPGVPPVQLVHGWASVEAKHHGVPFRFVTTHLETAQFPAVQGAQATEFLAGPAAGPGTVIAAGDFNSAADGSSTDTYRLLTGRFRDAWSEASPHGPGYTCCQSADLNGAATQLTSRIDLVLLGGAARAESARVVGAEPFRAAAPRYTSDHAGVTVTVGWRHPAGPKK
ncbi:endonuclease/exonuclease/phosphatase family protein [Actinoplanes sp. CA-252034]|uniref:endonuclease/exonuclease/phosphatase family protein n=1 Tax=Actinoplanes sp. CA-252034 TaxID=3239906 RepID=UPI003D96A2E6